MTPNQADLEDLLRTTFIEQTGTLARTPDAWSRTSRAIARSRHRRRAAVAATAAAVAVAGGGTYLVQRGFTGHSPSPAATSKSSDPTTDSATQLPLTSWPSRGRLATDSAWTGGLRATMPGRGYRLLRLLYADDVGESRVAVVAAQALGAESMIEGAPPPTSVVLLEGPRGSQPGLMKTRNWDQLSGEWGALAVSLGTPEERKVLVLTLDPQARVRISDQVRWDGQGVPHRTYRDVETLDGVALENARRGPTPRVQVTARGATVFEDAVTIDGIKRDLVELPAEQLHRILAARTLPQSVQIPISAVVHTAEIELGVPVTTNLVWAEKVDELWFAVLRFRTPDGAAFQSIVQVDDGQWGSGWSMVLKLRPVPSETASNGPFFWTPDTGRAGEPPLYVVAPGAATVHVAFAQGPGSLTTIRLDKTGFGRGMWPEGAPTGMRLTARTANGTVLATLPAHAWQYDDPLALHRDG